MFKRTTRTSSGVCAASARPSISLVVPPFSSGFSLGQARRSCRSNSTSYGSWPTTRRISRRKQHRSIRGTALFVVVVFPEPSPAGVDDGFTASLGFEPSLCWSGVRCHVLENRNQKGFRCETSKGFTDGRWLLSFFFKAVREALATQETMGPAMLPSAMMRTTAWKVRTSSSQYPGRRPPLMCY